MQTKTTLFKQTVKQLKSFKRKYYKEGIDLTGVIA